MLGVLPETLERLLGDDFLSSDMDVSESLEDLVFEAALHESYCIYCNPDHESQSDDGSELDEEEEEEEEEGACVDNECD